MEMEMENMKNIYTDFTSLLLVVVGGKKLKNNCKVDVWILGVCVAKIKV